MQSLRSSGPGKRRRRQGRRGRAAVVRSLFWPPGHVQSPRLVQDLDGRACHPTMPGVRQSLPRDSRRGRRRATRFRASVDLRRERATPPHLLRGHRGGGSSLRAHRVRVPGGLKRTTPPPQLCPGIRPDPGHHVVAEDRVRVARSRPTQPRREKNGLKPCASSAAPPRSRVSRRSHAKATNGSNT